MFSLRFTVLITFVLSVVLSHTPAHAERLLIKQSSRQDLKLNLWLMHQAWGVTDIGPLVTGYGTHDIFKWRVVEIPPGVYVDDVLAAYQGNPGVEAVEFDGEVNVSATPDDPFFSSSGSWGQSYKDLWGIHRVGLQGPWDDETGNPDIIVASIDTGIDRGHSDLSVNMWVNNDEIPNNGIDDDNNGYIDDVHGWDWANNDADPMDDHGHGTHTAGTIAAVGNNSTGVVGVVWSAKIMSLKFLSSSGSGTISGGVAAIKYAADNGAHISNNSWGGSGYYQSVSDAVDYAHSMGMVTVASAGNSNVDALGFSPANAPGSITVAATDPYDNKASFSNWGAKIDVTAPGTDVLSLRSAISPMCSSSRTVSTYYCRVSGTSMSGPHVAGLAALMLSHRPEMTPEQVRQALRMSTDDLGQAGRDQMHGYGLPIGRKMFENADEYLLAPYIVSPYTQSSHEGSTLTMVGNIEGSDFEALYVYAAPGRTSQDWVLLHESSTRPVSDKIADLDLRGLYTGTWRFQLRVVDSIGRSFEHESFDVSLTITDTEPPPPPPPPPPPEDTEPPTKPLNLVSDAPAPDHVVLAWQASTDNVGVAGYELFRDDVLLSLVGPDKLDYEDSTVIGSKTYKYTVRAFDDAGNFSELSTASYVRTPDPEPEPEPPPQGPPPPEFVRVYHFGGHGAVIVWSIVAEAEAYLVFRDNDVIAFVDKYHPFFYDRYAPPSGRSIYRIVSVDSEGNPGEPSDPAWQYSARD